MNRQDYLDGKITHEDYYKGLAKEHSITIIDAKLFGLNSVEELRAKLAADEHLNNIPLRVFDGITGSYNIYNPYNPLTLSDGCCIYKTLLKQLAS